MVQLLLTRIAIVNHAYVVKHLRSSTSNFVQFIDMTWKTSYKIMQLI